MFQVPARVGKILGIVVFGAAVGALFQNCSESLPEQAKADLASQGASPLSIQSSTTNIASAATLQLTGAGGTPPYVLNVITGSGTLDSQNLFTAPAVTETNIVQITDAKNNTAVITINVLAPLTLTYSPASAFTTEKIKLTATGGKAPYTFSLLAGVGSLAGDEFTPGATAATTLLKVTDADGRTVQLSVGVTVPTKLALYKLYEPTGAQTLFNPDPNAGVAYGYASQGVSFNMFAANMANSVPITRCYYSRYAAYPMYTTYVVGTTCAQPAYYTNGGVVGYLSSIARPNTVPVYGVAAVPGQYGQSAAELSGLGYTPTIVGYAMP